MIPTVLITSGAAIIAMCDNPFLGVGLFFMFGGLYGAVVRLGSQKS